MAQPVGENGWLDLVDEASRMAANIEQRISVMERYKDAITAEPWSLKLWLANCEWVWSLYTDCQNGDAGWPEEEQMLGREIFSLQTALDSWQEGYQGIKYRINDSHELWNRWIAIELDLLSKAPEQRNVDRVRALFLDRLQIPHATWEDTFSMFSGFVTKYDHPAAYEETMVSSKELGRTAVELYSLRAEHEAKLVKAGNGEAFGIVLKDYLSWEMIQVARKPTRGIISSPRILCAALFERALCSAILCLDPSTWEDYLDFLSTVPTDDPQALPSVLHVAQRATNHYPWSGRLWARYLLRAEYEGQPFEIMHQIKHAATNTELDRDGMEGVVEFYIAWSGYLKRMATARGATDEQIDVAEMGLPTVLEDVDRWGKRRYGKEWKGDPSFRVERIFIQYVSDRGMVGEARKTWRNLVKTHGDSYEFWQQYYLWEMSFRDTTTGPALATAVLAEAVARKTLDWPEKMMEIYIRHCENYEKLEVLLKAMSYIHHTSKGVAKRRAKEAAEAAAIYAQKEPEIELPSSATKRKRETDLEEVDEGSDRKVPKVDHTSLQEQHLTRDRENTTVMVSGLPAEITQTKLRQYFKEYGHINNITSKTEADGVSTTALIEFKTPEEAQSALLRDQKYFLDKQITVNPGTGLTLFVTNFPPTADDAFLQNLFVSCGEVFSIRWPSLKHNTHRRFCYVSFRTTEAAMAATKLDGQSLGGVYKLVAKYSDPAAKKDRDGAMAEGREIHVTCLDTSLNEEDIRSVFSKYGTVERVRLLKNMSGQSKGACFVVFEKKEQATAALDMDKTKLKSRVLMVEMSVGKNFKPTATVLGKASSASPAPASPMPEAQDADGDSAMSPSPAPANNTNGHSSHAPSSTEVRNRTMTLMNIPDTVNGERLRALVETHGDIVKLTLRPDHQGAIIEYGDAVSAGRASLALENYEIAPGRKLRTGGMKELLSQKEEIRSDRIQIGQGKKEKTTSSFTQPAVAIRRPLPGTGTGRRGGLGQKRGLGYSALPRAGDAEKPTKDGSGVAKEEIKEPKSNADFKAMFVSGGRA